MPQNDVVRITEYSFNFTSPKWWIKFEEVLETKDFSISQLFPFTFHLKNKKKKKKKEKEKKKESP